MTFTSIPTGTRVFLDANTLVYAAIAHQVYGTACKLLLDRVEHQDLLGFTSADALGDVAHRLMTIEACDRFGWPAQGVANRLRRHPAEVRQLVVPAEPSMKSMPHVLMACPSCRHRFPGRRISLSKMAYFRVTPSSSW
jgi:hypothetical protein